MRALWVPVFLFVFIESAWAGFVKLGGIEKAALYRIYVSNFDDNLLYTTSSNSLFRSRDGGKTWKKILVAKDEGIRDLCVDDVLYDNIYLATTSSLYRIFEDKIEKVFISPPEVEIKCVGKNRNTVYVGTTSGLYSSSEDTTKWKKEETLPQDLVVYSIDFSSQSIYLASNLGVYVSFDGKRFKRSFPLIEEQQEQEEFSLVCRVIKVDYYFRDKIYLGTSKGLFFSEDKGNRFIKVHLPIIENADIRAIAKPKSDRNNLYLGTNRGIFKVNLKDEVSEAIFEGLPTKDIFDLDFDKRGRLFVATTKGLYFKEEYSRGKYTRDLDKLLKYEPSIREVQEAALRYNEVHPEKIRRWRKHLKFRAILPTVSLDYDKTINYDSSSDRYYIGPRDWGLSFSWDLGDLIWNTYQDDIDTRSRLNTQLRTTILDDVNGLYYERLRIKIALKDPTLPDEERMKKELRLRELTASLDGYTGGYFSKRLKELRSQ